MRDTAIPTKFEMVDGRLFDPLAPDVGKIGIETIATVLSNSCRFGGHVDRFYSTAQHSVLVAFLSPRDLPAQRYALLHDADEAFGLPDMLTMLKPSFPTFVSAQARIGDAIERRFELDHDDHARIKPADRQALVLEKAQMKRCLDSAFWASWSYGVTEVIGLEIRPLLPGEARDLFLHAYHQVFECDCPIDADWLATQAGFDLDPETLSGISWLDEEQYAASSIEPR